jgi:hypothetical protein
MVSGSNRKGSDQYRCVAGAMLVDSLLGRQYRSGGFDLAVIGNACANGDVDGPSS